MLFINADDYGISSGVNSGTLKCIKTGVINSISIVPNGYAFENGIKKVLNKKIKKLSIHLNLI